MPEELAYFKTSYLHNQYDIYKVDEFEFPIYEYQNKRILLGYTGLGTTFAASVVTLIHKTFQPGYIF